MKADLSSGVGSATVLRKFSDRRDGCRSAASDSLLFCAFANARSENHVIKGIYLNRFINFLNL